MAVTFNFELNNKPSKNKTYAILLRITQNQKHKRIKTPIAVSKKSDFNKDAKQGNWIRQENPIMQFGMKLWHKNSKKQEKLIKN